MCYVVLQIGSKFFNLNHFILIHRNMWDYKMNSWDKLLSLVF